MLCYTHCKYTMQEVGHIIYQPMLNLFSKIDKKNAINHTTHKDGAY